ncbi:uncharacterized protein LOC143338293 [Chaetodon auriga]|uniref:uncharacterized protein LOC143338293 n=1 Tax=Chaetodon auriga TaxID=39042 RepID=UPI00403310C7
MELLTATLVIALLTTASAKPIGWRLHYDADITDNDVMQGCLDRNDWWSWWCTEVSSYKDSSSESDQSQESWESSESSESQSSEESSEEVLITDHTTPVMTTTDMTTISPGDGSTLTPEPGAMSTDEPDVTVTPPAKTTTSVTHCVTEDIPTAAPITENRGDN